MNKFIGAFIIVLFIGAFVWHYGTLGDRVSTRVTSEKLEELNKYDFEYDYPSTALEVVKIFGDAQKLVYGGNVTREDEELISEIVEIQRNLMDDELLLNNNKDLMVLKYMENMTDLASKELKIVDVKEVEVYREFQDEKIGKMKFVNSIEYVNKGENVYKQYGLRQDANGNYKILTMENIPPFEVK